MWAIYRREMRQYLMTPLAWIVWVVFLFLVGLVFVVWLARAQDAAGNPMMGADMGLTEFIVTRHFGFVKFILILLVPAFSMRLFAEEKQSGTLELLYTYPLTEVQMIMGKLLSALSVTGIMLALTFPPIFLTARYGSIDWAVLWCSYFGLLLMVLVALSFGVFVSSCTNSQVIAFIVTLVTLLVLWLASVFAGPVSTSGAGLLDVVGTAFKSLFTFKLAIFRESLVTILSSLLHDLSLTDHFDNFSKGIVSSTDVLYYLSMSAFFLFLTAKQLESRKWRGAS